MSSKLTKKYLRVQDIQTSKKLAHRKQKSVSKHFVKNRKNVELKMNSNRMIKRRKKAMSKIGRLSNLDVSEFLVKHNIKDTTELYALAQGRKKEDNKDLANYILS